ncbi:RagB/SusD family nutrient uptake outer membrane protein [Aestuariibaculum sediminum]|uniref:RagB/SusD family nutrient uptake outer membrane protein n=1 Tax=Aestuariibaculum sediminum TaxID=2770637 RepID=A0A8J6U8S7_9FLAO|nr:RagB/SusD family nutrient uptake outer membrane protein [Aestuariibaculum sediminum]MBD0833398.1 RagB/SusD family nutrient uptake outer membrane protein [Aestuariibaculum sediminum]
MKIRIFQFLLITVLFSSCSDYLDVSPKANVKAEDLFKDESGYNDALVGVYTIMSTKSLYGDVLSYGYLDVLAQYYTSINNNEQHRFINAVDYDYDNITEENRIKPIWSDHYKAIANLNAILEFIDSDSSNFSEGVYEVFKGETLALRAYLHFNLLRLFAQAPVLGTDVEAIPYVDVYGNEPQPASTIAEVLGKIKTDLELARTLMQAYDPYGPNYELIDEATVPRVLEDRQFRMNYFAATALFAKVSLYEGNYEMALKYAQEVIGTADGITVAPVSLFQFSSISDDVLASSETIFGLSISKLSEYSDVYFGIDAASGLKTNFLAINSAIIDQVYTSSGGSVEVRGMNFFGASSGGLRPLAKFEKDNERRMPQFRISELYLLAAEAETDINNAIAYYNAFTANRGIEPQENVSREELDDLIKKEFQKEFIGEGKMFFFNKRKNSETIGILEDVDMVPENYVLPIPAAEYEFGNL